jgi:hypothetical protein
VPSWFAGAVEHILAPIIRDMKDDIGDMKDNIGDMKDNIRVMKDDIRIMKVDILDVKRVQDQVWKLAAKVSNISPLIPPLMTI